MKKFSLTSKVLSLSVLLPALIVIAVCTSSCKKESIGKPSPATNTSATTKSMKLRKSVVNVLRDFSAATSGGSATSSSGSGSGVWSSGISYTTFSTPTATVYEWSDPSTGTSFTLSESTGGSGLGQLTYSGKTVDYNYVLSIKATDSDPTWSGFFSGRDLRGAVAIEGNLTDGTFELKNLAIFFVATTGGEGTYKFIDFSSTSVGTADGLGEIIDLGDSPASLASIATTGKVYITSGGHVNVSESAFEMASDAKLLEVTTNVETTLEGTIMFE